VSPSNSTVAERLTRLETEMAQLLSNQKERKQETRDINDKLDSLLALRHKGLGAFWLATSLAGVGGVSLLFQLLGWLGWRVP